MRFILIAFLLFTFVATNSTTHSSLIPAEPFCPEGNGFFVLYYGDKEADINRIIKAQPNFVVLPRELNKSEVAARFHPSIRVLMYVEMTYSKDQAKQLFKKGNLGCTVLRPAAEIDNDVDRAINNGFDGIFFDCAKDSLDDKNVKKNNTTLINELSSKGQSIHDWNNTRVQNVKKTGAKLVIMNPGVHEVDERMFDYADIVSVENQYDLPVKTRPNNKSFPSWRWLAVQGDPGKDAAQTGADAIEQSKKFNNENGGFWYYSPPKGKKATHGILFDDQPPAMNFSTFAEYARKRPVQCSQ